MFWIISFCMKMLDSLLRGVCDLLASSCTLVILWDCLQLKSLPYAYSLNHASFSTTFDSHAFQSNLPAAYYLWAFLVFFAAVIPRQWIFGFFHQSSLEGTRPRVRSKIKGKTEEKRKRKTTTVRPLRARKKQQLHNTYLWFLLQNVRIKRGTVQKCANLWISRRTEQEAFTCKKTARVIL